MTRAYDTLSDDLKTRLQDLSAVNRVAEGRRTAADGRIRMSKEQLAKTPDVVHPVIRTHPETGRKSLYVSQSHTDHIIGVGERRAGFCWRTCSNTPRGRKRLCPQMARL